MGKKSKAWTFFKVTTGKDKAGADCPAGKCNFCHEVILTKDYTTTPLIGHLQANHPAEYHVVRADIDAKKAAKAQKVQDKDAAAAGVHDPIPSTSRGTGRTTGATATATASAATRPGLHKFPMMSAEQLKLDMEVTIFLATTNSSFAMVDSDQWKRLMAHLCPRMNIKHRTTYGGAKLNLVYDQLMSVRDDLLLTELPSVSTLAITFDHWSSRNNDPFIVVTAHYINKDFVLRKLTLGLLHQPERHTAENIAEYLDKMVENIPPLTQLSVVATIDQAANMKAALRQSKSVSGVDDISLLCADHMLNTCVQNACQNRTTDARLVDAIQQARTVCSRLHQSFKSEEVVMRICQNLRLKYKKIPSPSPSRWNSHEMMFAGVIELEAALVRASQDPDFGCEVPTAASFKLLNAILPILTLIRRVSELLSTDERPTMDQALLQIFMLRSKIVSNLNAAKAAKDNTGLVEFLEALLTEMDKRFTNCGGDFYHYRLGHFLHPFHKGILLKRLPKAMYDETIQELVEEDPSTAVYKANSLDNAAKAHEKTLTDAVQLVDDDDEVAEFLSQITKDVFTQQQKEAEEATTPPIRKEIDSYLKRTVFDPNINVLDWWKQNQSEYPLLASLARGVYCHPASSASSERAFSQAGLTLTTKRQRMSTSTLEKLCFVNQNFKVLGPMVSNWIIAPEEEEAIQDEEEETEADVLEATQLESSVPPWLGFLEREKSRKRAASPDTIELDSAPSGASTPKPKRHKGKKKGKKGKGKSNLSSQASQSLLGDDDDDLLTSDDSDDSH